MLNRNSTLLLATLIINNIAVAALNDTGITTCSNETQNGLPCPVAGFPDQNAKSAPILKTAGQWSSTGSMSTARFNHTATLLPSGKVLVAGGVAVDSLSSAEIYDPSTGSWSSTAAMSTARASHTATLLPSGKVLVSGGMLYVGQTGRPLSSAEVYDPSTDSWSSTAAMSTTHSVHTATLLPSGKVLVAGKWYYSSAEIYDPSTGSWSSIAAMSTARYEHTATLLPSGKVLVAGGENNSGSLSSVEVYDPSTGSWSSTAAMSTSRMSYPATLLPSGKILVAGGFYCSGNCYYLSSAEIYDPNTARWSNTAAMSTERVAHTATLLPNGKVLVTGGWLGYSSAELYDSNTDSWSSTAAMSTARSYHTATLLPGGKVLVAGGSDSSAELYDPGTSYPIYTVTPSAGTGGTISPNTAQSVNQNATASFTVTPNTGYTRNNAVGGTCPAGNWNNNVWTTGAITANCSVNFSFNPIITAPTVTTNAASNITQTSATLNGTVLSSGATAYVTFDFGTTTNYGTNSAATPYQVYSASTVAVTANKTGLTCNTTYHYRVQASNSAGTSYGYNQSFTTAACPTYTVTPNVGNGGSVSPNTQQTVNSNTSASFTVTPNSGYVINTSIGGTCPQGYWNGNVWTTGAITANCSVNFSFNLITAAPIVTTTGPSNITATSATLNGNVTSAGATATASFAFGPTNAYGTTIAANPAQITSTTPVAVSANKTGLTCNTIYNYRLQATNSVGTNYGANQSLQTAACPAFTVTPSVGNGGNINPNAAQTVNPGSTASFTVTPNAAYTRNLTVDGTCPQGTWNSNVWTTGAITANCTVSFSFTIKTYTVTPTAGNGGTVSPSFQTVNHGATTSFTVTPNTGYTKNTAVTGTCPQGSWNGGSTSSPGVWTTGAITAPCSVNFSFTLIPIPVNGVCGSANGSTFTTAPTTNLCSTGTASGVSGSGPWTWSCAGKNGGSNASCAANIATYTVTPTAGTGGTVSPNTPQTVTHGAKKAFTVAASTGYTKNNAVGGTCPTGTWNGNVWTTGIIVANCTVNFSFNLLPVNSWLNPPSPTILRDRPFTLEVIANSNSVKLGSYEFAVTLDPDKLLFDTAYQNANGTCSRGVCPGTNALFSRINRINATADIITLNGDDEQGVGPGNDLQLLIIHLKTKLVMGTTQVTLTTTQLTTPTGGNIGTEARGATVKVSYGYCGDADGNLSVNIVDALAIARKVVGLNPPPTVDVTLADVDNNGTASIVDAMHIARYSVGLLTPPEVCAIGLPL